MSFNPSFADLQSPQDKNSGFIKALKSWRIWYFLGKYDILQRYRGSVLGPFWITISTSITVLSMGYLYGILFGIDRATYLPYFATGMITWNFISMIINESTKIFYESKPYMENINLSCMIYIYRLIFRNLIVFLHNFPVYITIAVIYKMHITLNLFFLIPGVFILCLNGVFFGSIIAFISTRFPDVGSMVSSILQIIFFVTPVMWSPANLPEKYHLFLTYNPFYYFVNLLRNPLLGQAYNRHEITGIITLTFIGLVLSLVILRYYSRRVIFWL